MLTYHFIVPGFKSGPLVVPAASQCPPHKAANSGIHTLFLVNHLKDPDGDQEPSSGLS